MKPCELPPSFYHRHVAETDSTSREVRALLQEAGDDKPFLVLSAGFQTAGRGQRGNSWESARDENLLFSVLARPVFLPAAQQFYLSCVASLAVRDALALYAEDVCVKWPNDVYLCGRKVCGILIECDLAGNMLERVCMGIGINVNQTEFLSDAPNPVSLRQVLQKTVAVDELFCTVLRLIEGNYGLLKQGRGDELLARYVQLLFRREGMYDYRDGQGEFRAEIVSVDPDGHLQLRDEQGCMRRYAFKEVKFVFPRFSLS